MPTRFTSCVPGGQPAWFTPLEAVPAAGSADGAGDLGFFTQPDYRRRGLGTIAASAALEYGFANALHQVNWICDAGNPGSIRTAEKLGLERIEDYHQVVLIMDEKSHMAFLGRT